MEVEVAETCRGVFGVFQGGRLVREYGCRWEAEYWAAVLHSYERGMAPVAERPWRQDWSPRAAEEGRAKAC